MVKPMENVNTVALKNIPVKIVVQDRGIVILQVVRQEAHGRVVSDPFTRRQRGIKELGEERISQLIKENKLASIIMKIHEVPAEAELVDVHSDYKRSGYWTASLDFEDMDLSTI